MCLQNNLITNGELLCVLEPDDFTYHNRAITVTVIMNTKHKPKRLQVNEWEWLEEMKTVIWDIF